MAEDKKALFERVMAAVAEHNATEAESFTRNCRGYGKVAVATLDDLRAKAATYHSYLTGTFGEAGAAAIIPDLTQLIPDTDKRRALEEHHREHVANAQAAAMFGGGAEGCDSAEGGGSGAHARGESDDFLNAYVTPPAAPKPAAEVALGAAVDAAAAKEAKEVAEAAEAAKAATATKKAATEAEGGGAPADAVDPLAPLMEDMAKLDTWGFNSRECAAQKEVLARCCQYVEGLCHWEESVVRAWHVNSLNEWNVKQPRVLVLCGRSYFRVEFDAERGRLVKFTKMPMNDVELVEPNNNKPGDPPGIRVHTGKPDGSAGPFSSGKVRTYHAVVPREGPGSDARVVAAEMKRAFEVVAEQTRNVAEETSRLSHFRRLMLQGIEVYRHFPPTGEDGAGARELWVLHLSADGERLMLGLAKNHVDALSMPLPEVRSIVPDEAHDLRFVISHPRHESMHIEVDTPKSRKIVSDLLSKLIFSSKKII